MIPVYCCALDALIDCFSKKGWHYVASIDDGAATVAYEPVNGLLKATALCDATRLHDLVAHLAAYAVRVRIETRADAVAALRTVKRHLVSDTYWPRGRSASDPVSRGGGAGRVR